MRPPERLSAPMAKGIITPPVAASPKYVVYQMTKNSLYDSKVSFRLDMFIAFNYSGTPETPPT
jgi:hypothetical protein